MPVFYTKSCGSMESRGWSRVMAAQMRLYTFAWSDHPVEGPSATSDGPGALSMPYLCGLLLKNFAASFSQNISPSYFYIVILFTFVIYGAGLSGNLKGQKIQN